jgi:hypothetical protein
MLFNEMEQMGMTSLLRYFDKKEETWSREGKKSQIDDIYVSNSMLMVITAPKIVNVEEITNSDHRMISMEWQLNMRVKQYRTKKRKRWIYLYNEMSKEKWNDFAEKVESEITRRKSADLEIGTEEMLNKQWNRLEQDIKKAAAEEIPRTKVGPKTFYAFSKKATKLHIALKRINKVISEIREGNIEVHKFKRKINEELRDVGKLCEVEIKVNFEEHETEETTQEKVEIIKEYQKMIYKARKLENEITRRQEIENHIKKRYDNFASNTKKMIDSILQRNKEPVEFKNIKKVNQIITEPTEIKEEIKKHFEKWTKHNPVNTEEWEKWEETYKPIERIDESWYEGVNAEIQIEELEKTLKEAPNNKATGPQGIANEMLKNLKSGAKNRLLKILNACLRLKTIPNGWKKSRIYPIAKKETFTGTLEETRPITLTEHSRKILTKIITKRLSQKLDKYPILNMNNHVALPNTLTEIPIVTTMHMMEDAHVNDKEMWILCQDISKAYDSIHIPTLQKALKRIKVNEEIVELIGNIFEGRENTVITSLGTTGKYGVQDGVDQGEPIAPLL